MTTPAIPFLHATYISPKASEVASFAGSSVSASTAFLRFALDDLSLKTATWSPTLDQYLTAGDGRWTRQMNHKDWKVFVEALRATYPEEEQQMVTDWADKVRAEAAAVKAKGAEYVEISVSFPAG